MSWMDDKKKPVGRPRLSDEERRYEIRPTVSKLSKDWLKAQDEPQGRVIDKLIVIYQMRNK
jgi:hypothetical protein